MLVELDRRSKTVRNGLGVKFFGIAFECTGMITQGILLFCGGSSCEAFYCGFLLVEWLVGCWLGECYYFYQQDHQQWAWKQWGSWGIRFGKHGVCGDHWRSKYLNRRRHFFHQQDHQQWARKLPCQWGIRFGKHGVCGDPRRSKYLNQRRHFFHQQDHQQWARKLPCLWGIRFGKHGVCGDQ